MLRFVLFKKNFMSLINVYYKWKLGKLFGIKLVEHRGLLEFSDEVLHHGTSNKWPKQEDALDRRYLQPRII